MIRFIAVLVSLVLAGCKSPFEPEQTSFEKYTDCVASSKEALGLSTQAVCFRRFARPGNSSLAEGRARPSDPRHDRVTVTSKADGLLMIDSIYLRIPHEDGSIGHEVIKQCEPVVISPRETARIECSALRDDPVTDYLDGLKHHDKDEAYWNYNKVLFLPIR